MRKPKNLKFKGTTVIEVFEDFYGEHFDDELKCFRDVYLWDNTVFGDFSNKDQAALARKLAKFFIQYAEWISTKKDGKA